MSRLAMVWRSGCVLLLAAVWTVLAADGPAPTPKPAAWHTAKEAPAAFLQRLEQAGAGLAPAQRLTAQGTEAVVQAVAAAHVLGGAAPPPEWGAKRYGEDPDPDGRRAFDIVGEFMAGKYGRLIELAEAVGRLEREQHHSVRWHEIADRPDQAAGQDPAHGLDANWSATRIRAYAEGLVRCKAPAAVREAARAAVLKAFPDAPGVSRALAPLDGAPAAPAQRRSRRLRSADRSAGGHLALPIPTRP